MKRRKSIELMILCFAGGLVFAFGSDQFQRASVVEGGETIITQTAADAACKNTAQVGCCGKCTTELLVAEEVSNSEEECQGNCDACPECDSATCECSVVLTEEQSKVEPDQPAKQVNTMPEDRDIFHFLLANHKKITRTVTEFDNGVMTVTESDDPVIAEKIQEHVASMYGRVKDRRPLRMWDELYREIFRHSDKIDMKVENTTKGVAVTETSGDEYVVKLIQAHAKVVTGFSEHGFGEARKNHEPPKN